MNLLTIARQTPTYYAIARALNLNPVPLSSEPTEQIATTEPRRALAGWTRIAVVDGTAHRMFSDTGPRCSVTGEWWPSTIGEHGGGPRCQSTQCFGGAS